jgi:hypothetical protein
LIQRVAEHPTMKFVRNGKDHDAAGALSVLARAAAAQGDRLEAIRLGRESAALAEQAGFTWWHGLALLTVAEWLLQERDLDAAEAACAAGLDSLVEVDDRVNLPAALATASVIAAQRNNAGRAGQLFGAVEAIAEREPRQTTTSLLAEVEPQLAPVQGDEFDKARAQGRTLSLAEAIDYTRRGLVPSS